MVVVGFFFRQSARKRLSAFISSLHIVNNKAHQVRPVGGAAEATAALEGNERPMEHRLKVFLLLLLVVLVLIKKMLVLYCGVQKFMTTRCRKLQTVFNRVE